MKKILIILCLAGILSCSFPVIRLAVRETPTPIIVTTPIRTLAPQPTPQIGSDANPLILALSPSAHPNEAVIAAGEQLAAQLHTLSGYTIVTTTPVSEQALLDALGNNNAHIAVLSPFGYLLAYKNGTVSAALASLKSGELLYGAQYIANRESLFDSFYDEQLNENTAEAPSALLQFNSKKPCWSDATSPSGYVVPLGYLNQSGVHARTGAFLEGQPTVVRAVYAEDICDFGATFIDARTSPALEGDYPDVLDKVVIIWRIPDIIPYENISFAKSLPLEMRRVLVRVFMDLMNTAEGKSAMETIYGIEALQAADDSLYIEFEKYTTASGLDLLSLLQ